MDVMTRAEQAIRGRGLRVVFPEIHDPRVKQAAARLEAEDLAVVLPVAPLSQAQVAAVEAVRGMKRGMVERLLRRETYRAAAMVSAGEADAMVAGAESPTAEVIKAAGLCIGLAMGVDLPSSFFLMRFSDGREMIWADCAVVATPDAAQLETIARSSAISAQALLGAARVALLSFSTGTSGTGPSVEMVRQVAAATGFAGPVQADAALNKGIAQRKGIGTGDANVLVFPSLDAGNIAYKLAQELAGAQAVGPMLQGFARPVADLSRGASAEDIFATTVLTLAGL